MSFLFLSFSLFLFLSLSTSHFILFLSLSYSHSVSLFIFFLSLSVSPFLSLALSLYPFLSVYINQSIYRYLFQGLFLLLDLHHRPHLHHRQQRGLLVSTECPRSLPIFKIYSLYSHRISGLRRDDDPGQVESELLGRPRPVFEKIPTKFVAIRYLFYSLEIGKQLMLNNISYLILQRKT